MPGRDRKIWLHRPIAVSRVQVSVADSTRDDFHQGLPRPRRRYRKLSHHERLAEPFNNCCSHDFRDWHAPCSLDLLSFLLSTTGLDSLPGTSDAARRSSDRHPASASSVPMPNPEDLSIKKLLSARRPSKFAKHLACARMWVRPAHRRSRRGTRLEKI